MPANVAVQFFDRVAASPDSEAFRFPRGEAWESRHLEAGRRQGRGPRRRPDRARRPARAARRHRLRHPLRVDPRRPRDHVRRAARPRRSTRRTNAEDTVYILGDSESRVVFAEDDEQLAKLTAHRAELPHVTKVVTFDGTGRRRLGHHPRRPRRAGCRQARRAARRRPHDVAGDRARPARHPDLHLRHHRPPQGRAAARTRRGSTRARPSARRASCPRATCEFRWLPMAHSFGKVLMSTQMACGFAAAIDGRVDKIVDNLGVVKPTFMGAAPRIFEKAHGRIVTMQAAEGGAKEKLFKARLRHRPRGRAPQARGQVGPDRAQGQARPVRQARLQQGARPLRWTRPLLHLRCRRAQPRHRRVVRRGRHHDPRGLRPDRDLGGLLRQPPRPATSSARSARSSRAARSSSARTTRS